MAARSWPGAGPKLHTWDTPGPLLYSAAGQGFRRHLPSQPARPGAPCACAVLPLPCRRGPVPHTSIGLPGVGRAQKVLLRPLLHAQGPAQPFGRVKRTAAGAGQLPRSHGRHFDLRRSSGPGHISSSRLKPRNEERPGPHPWEILIPRVRGVVPKLQLSLGEESQWRPGRVQLISQTRGSSWGGARASPQTLPTLQWQRERWDVQHLYKEKKKKCLMSQLGSPSWEVRPTTPEVRGRGSVSQASSSDTEMGIGWDTVREAKSLTREVQGEGWACCR